MQTCKDTVKEICETKREGVAMLITNKIYPLANKCVEVFRVTNTNSHLKSKCSMREVLNVLFVQIKCLGVSQ